MASPHASGASKSLSERVRSMEVLVEAWHAIRRNAETSRTRSTREEAQEFGRKLPQNLAKIQKRLRKGYKFEKAYGATPSKGHGKAGKRPIVVAPLVDRIVQRAILDVLQKANDLPAIKDVLGTENSVGGIPGRGVENAIALFDGYAAAGFTHVAGSDIAGFFTKIPKKEVIKFLAREIDDLEFLNLIDAALTVELSNAEKLAPDDLHLFPTGDDGVAQGCPLSALAGNIVLYEFDRQMNDPARGLRCIRYIDDFIIVGRKRERVLKGMEAAKAMLKALQMDVYDPLRSPKKAFVGRIGQPHVFLGRELIPGQYPPSAQARASLQRSIRELINNGQKSIDKAARGQQLRPLDKPFAATIVAINNTVRGWRGCYRSSNCPDVFDELDVWIARRVKDFERYLNTHTSNKPVGVREQALGVAPLRAGNAPTGHS